jgi:hypothetical protein
MWMRKYRKKLEKRFKNGEIGRRQLNFTCDVGLIARLRLLAKYLHTPFYLLAEHALELGLSEIRVKIQDSALTEILQRHLLNEHLSVKDLSRVERYISDRAKRIDNALKLLEVIESRAGGPEVVGKIIDRILKESQREL